LKFRPPDLKDPIHLRLSRFQHPCDAKWGISIPDIQFNGGEKSVGEYDFPGDLCPPDNTACLQDMRNLIKFTEGRFLAAGCRRQIFSDILNCECPGSQCQKTKHKCDRQPRYGECGEGREQYGEVDVRAIGMDLRLQLKERGWNATEPKPLDSIGSAPFAASKGREYAEDIIKTALLEAKGIEEFGI
jgi:hypothetical protein